MSLYHIKEAYDGEIPGRHTGEQHVYLLCKVVGVKYCKRNPNTIFQMDRMMLKPMEILFHQEFKPKSLLPWELALKKQKESKVVMPGVKHRVSVLSCRCFATKLQHIQPTPLNPESCAVQSPWKPLAQITYILDQTPSIGLQIIRENPVHQTNCPIPTQSIES